MLWLIVGGGAFLAVYRSTLIALWREPVLRHPVLIIESDDWGPAPAVHAQRLRRLIDMLGAKKDRRNRHPVMTLGVILAIPDGPRIQEGDFRGYCRLLLSEPQAAEVLASMNEGVNKGVFALQLHGMEHYWPKALMASVSNPAVRDWLSGKAWHRTEALPSPLQSRWIDGSVQPSCALPEDDIASAAGEEVDKFGEIFGSLPRVVVPPTFVWTRAVEDAWVKSGVKIIVTPGTCYTGRETDGKLIGTGQRLLNGQRSPSGAIYMVRDVYFEPAKGHAAEDALQSLERKMLLGRPALVETHRFNFTDDEFAERSFSELGKLLDSVVQRFPSIMFMSTEELAIGFEDCGADWLEDRLLNRLTVYLRRLREVPKLTKLAWLSGVALPVMLLMLGCKGLFLLKQKQKIQPEFAPWT
ncbi:glycosyl hydrolase [Methylocaldum marinum]|uniref:glycosyl hydrolase n=1 Tax=Methylocaldum marinum TaxID=1432792 RepID=UPI0011AE7ED6|nr:glycosyl hydrolase [Methylocaldum marinum]